MITGGEDTGVLVAHKFLALPASDRAQVDPLMSVFNLKDARAGDYIKKMVHLYPGCGAASAKFTSRNKNSPKRLPVVHRVSIVHPSTQFLM